MSLFNLLPKNPLPCWMRVSKSEIVREVLEVMLPHLWDSHDLVALRMEAIRCVAERIGANAERLRVEAEESAEDD